MSVEKTIDISVLPEAEQDLIKALFDKCYERLKPKEKVKKKPRVWKPKYGGNYWFIFTDGDIGKTLWYDKDIDLGRYSIGNCFRTEEEAIFVREKQKVKVLLQRFADEHNDPDKEEWDGNHSHFSIVYEALSEESIRVSRTLGAGRDESITYFTSKESVERAIKSIGKDKILKYLFDVDCEVDG